MGQHSSAVQAVVAVLFGLPTIVLLLVGTWAAYRSARASDQQAKAALAQTNVALHNLREQTRPIFTIMRKYPEASWTASGQRFSLTNSGPGVAKKLRVEIFKTRNKDSLGVLYHMQGFIFASGQTYFVPLQSSGDIEEIRAYYESIEGDTYTSFFSLHKDEALTAYTNCPFEPVNADALGMS